MTIGFRDRIKDMSPAMLKDGVGEREMYCFGLALDVIMEKRAQALDARRPPYARLDALQVLAGDRVITPGLTETRESLASRVQRAIDSWQTAGNAGSVLGQILGFVLAKTPMVRAVATRYDPSTYPATRVSTSWDTYPEGRDLSAEPVHAYRRSFPGGDGDLDWDSTSPITGSWTWWQGYVFLYSVGAQAWVGQAQAWGDGSTYTPDASGYYSTVSGDAYADAGSYSGTTQAWGAGGTYTAAASGYYSDVSGDGYVEAGSFVGDPQAWGVDANVSTGVAIARIVQAFKPANMWIRTVAISFSSSLFDPDQPSGGGVNPDGTFGYWSNVSGDAYAETRFSNAVYGGEIV